jgi:hypothetical protein
MPRSRSPSRGTKFSQVASDVEAALAFAKAAKRVGYVEPSEVDAHFRSGSAAFRRKDYAAAHEIFGALLLPMTTLEIDLGHDEFVEEVLATDLRESVSQYLVATYMVTAPSKRLKAVREATRVLELLAATMDPLTAMKDVAVEPLPDFEDFVLD